MAHRPAASRVPQDNPKPSRQLPNLALTERDGDIVRTLATKVRCLSVSLVAKVWWPDTSPHRAAKRLDALAASGWLTGAVMYARKLPSLEQPLLTWRIGEGTPDFGGVSYVLRHRFTEPAKPTAIYVASSKAARHFGGASARLPRVSEVTHDLGLATVYLLLRDRSPAIAPMWLSEGWIIAAGVKAGDKVPDALIDTPNGPKRAIEFGGEYGKRKLLSFHRYCDASRLEYELW